MLKLYQQRFKQYKPAYYASIVLILILIASLLLPIIANDKPLFIWHNGQPFLPMLINYSEADFGYATELRANYAELSFDLVIRPLIEFNHTTHDILAMELAGAVAPLPPSLNHILGTDDMGRDLAAQLLYGLRLSLVFAILLSVISTIIGVVIGAIQGYFGGLVDLVGQRLIEVWSSLPALYILIILSSVIIPSFWWLLLIMILFSWSQLVDVVRAEVLRVRGQDFIIAAKLMGVSNCRIIFRHILPNALIASITFLPFIMSGALVTLTALDFLGLGLPPDTPSLGKMLAQGKGNIESPHIIISVFMVLAALLTLFIIIGEGIRRALKTF
jgi:microcin C transport system permease protein